MDKCVDLIKCMAFTFEVTIKQSYLLTVFSVCLSVHKILYGSILSVVDILGTFSVNNIRGNANFF